MKIIEDHENGSRIELEGKYGEIWPILESWRANQGQKVPKSAGTQPVGFSMPDKR